MCLSQTFTYKSLGVLAIHPGTGKEYFDLLEERYFSLNNVSYETVINNILSN